MNNITLLLLFCCTLAGIPASRVCSCEGEPSIKNQLKQMDAVLVGTVVSEDYILLGDSTLDTTENPHIMPMQWVKKYEVLVGKVYKGAHIQDTVIIYSGRGGGDCGFRFKTGERYIIFGERKSYFKGLLYDFEYPEGENIYWTNICTVTTPYYEAGIRELEKYTRE